MKVIFSFKQMVRMFTRKKSTNILSISGLAIGIAIAMLIGFWAMQEFNFDTYHKNSDRIYRICREGIVNNEMVRLGSDFGPVTVIAKERFSEIEDINRIKSIYRPYITINHKSNFEEGFYCWPIPGIFLSFCIELMEIIFKDNSRIKRIYERRRSSFLEDQVEKLFRDGFQNVEVTQI